MNEQMDLQKLINALLDLEGPSRAIDDNIAEALGWSKRFATISDTSSDRSRMVQQNMWLVPSGEVREVPHYTKGAQEARMLVQEVATGLPCALVVENGNARAQLEGRPPFHAKTSAIALCLAAVSHMKEKSGHE